MFNDLGILSKQQTNNLGLLSKQSVKEIGPIIKPEKFVFLLITEDDFILITEDTSYMLIV